MCLLLVFCMAAGMTACGGDKEAEAANAAAKEHVFRAEDITLDTEAAISDARMIGKAGERLYLYASNYGETGMEEYLLSMNLDGSDVKTVPLSISRRDNGAGGVTTMPSPRFESELDSPAQETTGAAAEEDETEAGETGADADVMEPDIDIGKYPEAGTVSTSVYVSNMCSDGKQLYMLLNENYNDYSDESNPIYEETFYLMAMDTDGNELWRQELGKNESNSTSYVSVYNMVGTPDGVICNIQKDMTSTYVLFGTDGAHKGELSMDSDFSGSMYVNGKGEVYVQSWGEENGVYQQKVQKLDVKTGKLEDPLSVPGMSGYSSLNLCANVYGGAYDLYLYDAMSVYGYNIGDADKTELLNFIDSDLINNNYMLSILSDTEMVMTGMDYSANNGMGAMILSRLTKVDPADVKDKAVLQLACYGSLYEAREKVIKFNKTNEDYRIQITDYATFNSDSDWKAGINRLNSDIVSGKVPDIIYLNNMMPIASYISKGLFADLNPFIDKDPDMNREDFLPNIMDAFSVDGKLYQIVPNFNIMTVAAKSKFVGNEPGWTIDEMIALADSMPEAELFPELLRTTFMDLVLNQMGGRFADWNTGECRFDSPEFIQLLEFAKRFPAEFNTEDRDEYWRNYETMYREDRTLLQQMYMSTFRDYQRTKYGIFGEDITLIGMPASGDDNGATILYDTSLAMSAKSKHQDGAWAFIRQYLTDEYQDNITYGWPVSLDRIETLKQEAMQKPYYMDENGEKVEYDDYYWIGEEELVIPVATQEEIDTVMNIITSTTQISSYNEDVSKIVLEEAEAFFAGQKSAQEVAAIIQSRVSLYISENK